MNNILIDPVVLIVPSEDATRETVSAWIENLNVWLAEAFDSHHRWLHLAEMLHACLEYDHLPNFELFRRWQKKYGKDGLEIDIPELMNRISDFFLKEEFELGSKLEDHLMEAGYVIEPGESSISIAPRQFVDRWPDAIRDKMSLLLATACAGKCKGEVFASRLYIATLALPGGKREIEVSAVITFISDKEGQIDQEIAEILPLLFTPEDIEPLDAVSLWNRGEKGLLKAIEQKYRYDWQTQAPKPLPCKIGPRFMESITSRLDVTEALLRQIVKTMAGVVADKPELLKYKPHEVREREEAGTPQLVRESDGARAWRITITPEGAGWRMHYWKGYHPQLGSFIEFSNVLTKHDPVEIY